MMKKDILTSYGDNQFENGNYTQTSTVAGKLARSVMAHRGRWPGGHDAILGNDTWNNKQLKESDWQKILTWFGEAIQWMVDDELIVVKSIELAKVDKENVILIRVYDISERLDYQYRVTTPWNE